MIIDILSKRMAAINKEYKRLVDIIHLKEQQIKQLDISRLHLEIEISELDKRLEELEIEAVRDIHATGQITGEVK